MTEQYIKKIDEIHFALVGDQYRKGLIEDVEKLKTESRLSKVVAALVSGLAVIFGIFHN